MQFTYKAYEQLINTLSENAFVIGDYHNYDEYEKCAILRHDIDYDLKKAIPFSEIEKKNNVKSTYFVLLTSDFYNPSSKSSLMVFDELRNNGHEIGLHFDEVRYLSDCSEWSQDYLVEKIQKEAELLGKIIDGQIKTISMHRPSQKTLEANISIPGMVNSYSKEFFQNFKYVSDSRMRWRENINEIVESKEIKLIHILTHPFWYNSKEKEMSEVIDNFIERAKKDRLCILDKNITDLRSIMIKSGMNERG